MIIESLDIVFYTFMFLVPGYIIDEVKNSIVPVKARSEGVLLLRYLMYSILNCAVWFSWGLRLIQGVTDSSSIMYWVVLALLTVFTSILTGLVLGFIKSKDAIWLLLNKIFAKRSGSLIHPIPTAWDYIFSKMPAGTWVTIRMDNDKFIRGLYSTRSFASSDENFRDIFIEEVYMMDEDKKWVKRDMTGGVWLSPESIKNIEFWKTDNETEKEGKKTNEKTE